MDKQKVPSGESHVIQARGAQQTIWISQTTWRLLASSITTEVNQSNILSYQTAKTRLQVSVEKTKFLTNFNESSSELYPRKQSKIKKANRFKYLGEWLEPFLSEQLTLTIWTNKLEMACRLTKNIHDKRCFSSNTKFRHYHKFILPEILYTTE